MSIVALYQVSLVIGTSMEMKLSTYGANILVSPSNETLSVSYGGFLTLAAVTRYPDFFACAIEAVGMPDLEKLYRDTVSFEFNATSVYTSLVFFDSNHNVLGHFQAGAVSTVNGVGGGKGEWS